MQGYSAGKLLLTNGIIEEPIRVDAGVQLKLEFRPFRLLSGYSNKEF